MAVKQENFRPPGRCIYCDSRESLSREHIIPAGLLGNLVLPAASCTRCAIKTSQAEFHVLRAMYGWLRATQGIQSRRRKGERATSYNCTVVDSDGRRRIVSVLTSDLPVIYPVIDLPPPALLTFSPVTDMYPEMNVRLVTVQQDIADRLARLGGNWEQEIIINPTMFLAVIAKIAHSYAVAKLGIDGFTPDLRDLILLQEQRPWHYVGADPNDSGANTDTDLHKISLHVGKQGLLLARVQLFANFHMRPYSVVVGRLPSDFVLPAE